MSRPAILAWLLIAGLLAWCFAGALWGGGLFAYRDASHYYYPLFQFVQDQWSAGSMPLWNPQENLGVPLLANPTASVLYPGKLLFLLPLDYAWNYRLYVIAHVALAAVAAYLLARRWEATPLAAGVAAISYAFSGSVLFQYCNVIFLVGAAWLPVACLAVDQMLTRRSLGWAVALGIVLALMILGGDPQAAYHAGLLTLLYAFFLPRPSRTTTKASGAMPTLAWACSLRSKPALLFLAALTAILLAAVQILPAVEFSRASGRAQSTTARSLYEIPGRLLHTDANTSPWFDGLLCRRLDSKSHHEHVYHFSVGPWRLAEYLCPNVGGRQFPLHRRWMEVIPAEGRVWTPSLYMGLLPLVLALSAWRLRGGDPRTRWMSWAAVLALVASFGWYGLGWLAHEILNGAGVDAARSSWVGSPVGGLYWLMTVLLPGYIYFRYPAKLLVVAALGLSLLAARGWDQSLLVRSRGLRRGLVWLAGTSATGVVAALIIRPYWSTWMAGVAPDPVFGPLDAAGAHTDLLVGLVQTAILSTVFFLLLRLPARIRWMPAAALVLVAADLAIANGWLIACVPAELFQRPPLVATGLSSPRPLAPIGAGVRAADSPTETSATGVPPVLPPTLARRQWHPEDQPCRLTRESIWAPPSWQHRSSPDRMAELVRWSRDSLWPNYQLTAGLSLANVPTAIITSDYRAVLAAMNDPALSAEHGLPSFGKYAIRQSTPAAEAVRIELPNTDATRSEDLSLWYLPNHLPRAWIVHHVEVLPPLDGDDPETLRQRTREVFWTEGSGIRDQGSGAQDEGGHQASPRPLAGEGPGVRASGDVTGPVDSRIDSQAGATGVPPVLSPTLARRQWHPGGQAASSLHPRDLRRTAVVETTAQETSFPVPAIAPTEPETCHILRYEPLRVEIQAELRQPGLVVLCDQFYPGWTLEVTTAGQKPRELPILRTNRVMRGVWLEAGSHRLVYRYRPVSFLIGAVVSVVAWMALGAFVVILRIRRGRPQGSSIENPQSKSHLTSRR